MLFGRNSMAESSKLEALRVPLLITLIVITTLLGLGIGLSSWDEMTGIGNGPAGWELLTFLMCLILFRLLLKD